MRSSLAVFTAIVVLASVAAAQNVPRMETFLGYTFVRANSATDVPSFNANGGGGQFAYNFNQWIGAVADVGAVHNGDIGGANIDSTLVNYLFGPRISMRFQKLRPYFQFLWGGVHATSSTAVIGILVPTAVTPAGLLLNPVEPVSARVVASQSAFAMTAGGGLDIRLSKHVMFRPIGLDFYLTRLQNFRTMADNNQHNLRYTAGFNFVFGGKQ